MQATDPSVDNSTIFAFEIDTGTITRGSSSTGVSTFPVSSFRIGSAADVPLVAAGIEYDFKYVSSVLVREQDIEDDAIVNRHVKDIDASKVTSGTLNTNRIPNLSANKVTSGTLHADRIPNLSANKVTSDTLHADRIPNLSANKLTSGRLNRARLPAESDPVGKQSFFLPASSLTPKGVSYSIGSTSGVDRRFPRLVFGNSEGDDVEVHAITTVVMG